jgi:5'-nucleotidase
VNGALLDMDEDEKNLFDVILMSNNHAQCGVRYLNTIRHHKLNIERMCLTAGRNVTEYLTAYSTNLYLSTDTQKVKVRFQYAKKCPSIIFNYASGRISQNFLHPLIIL